MFKSWFLCFVLCFAGFSKAQEVSEDMYSENYDSYASSDSSSTPSDVEKIKVTGSRIKRIDSEGPSPLTVFTKQDINKEGYLGIDAFLTQTSISNFGTVSVHNSPTLTLVNGKRIIYDNTDSIEYVPKIAVDRIEILRDGGSAIYGADAVSGVINLITKRHGDSTEFTFKLAPTFPFHEGGNQGETSLLYTKDFSKGYFLTAFELQYEQTLKYKQRRQWYQGILRADYSTYPVFKPEEGTPIVDSRCPEDRQIKVSGQTTGCQGEKGDSEAYIRPEKYTLSNYSYVDYELGSDYTFYGQAIVKYLRTRQKDQPIVADDLPIPAGHKLSQGGGQAGSLFGLINKYPWDALTETYFLDATAGLKGYIYNTWDFDFSLKTSHLWAKRSNNGIVKQSFIDAVVEGTYDPFLDKLDLSDFHVATRKTYDTRIYSNLDFSGEFLWDSGLAFGFAGYHNRYETTPDKRVEDGEIYALASAASSLRSRYFLSSYAELSKTFANMLEIHLAGRLDYYNDYGFTFNPKVAARFQPSENFLFRASYGESFQAPPLWILEIEETSGYAALYDTVACYNELNKTDNPEVRQAVEGVNEVLSDKSEEEREKIKKDFLVEQSQVLEGDFSEDVKKKFGELAGQIGLTEYCRETYIRVKYKGNKDIKPNEGRSFSLGAIWQITKNHSISFDYWDVLQEGLPGGTLLGNKKTIDAELTKGKEFVESHGVIYEREDEATNPFTPIKSDESAYNTFANLSSNFVRGIDVSWKSNFKDPFTKNASIYFQNDFTTTFVEEIELFPEMGFVNSVDKSGYPRWRNFATLGWRNDKHNLSLKLKTTAGTKQANNESERVRATHLLDLFYSYIWSDKISILTGFYNALFLPPAKDASRKQEWSFNSTFYDVRGSSYFVEWRQKF